MRRLIAFLLTASATSLWLLTPTLGARGGQTTGANKPGLPPLILPAYPMPRPPEVVREVYRFAAEHPDVLRFVPCFCGCEQSGHRSSVDCFVNTRATDGAVRSWNEHGFSCAMCLAVAERAMRMHGAHASIKEIRADVERSYGHVTGNRTPTPLPK